MSSVTEWKQGDARTAKDWYSAAKRNKASASDIAQSRKLADSTQQDLSEQLARDKRVGAGRGEVNPPAAKSDEVKAMLQDVQDAKDQKKISDMGYAKGGKVKGWGQARGARAAKIV